MESLLKRAIKHREFIETIDERAKEKAIKQAQEAKLKAEKEEEQRRKNFLKLEHFKSFSTISKWK